MEFVAGAAQILILGGALWVAVRRFRKHRAYGKLVLDVWLLLILAYGLMSVAMPLLFLWAGVGRAFRYFPETTTLVPCVLLGWVAGLEVAALVWVGRSLWAWLRGRRASGR
jgi:hypothetical protein